MVYMVQGIARTEKPSIFAFSHLGFQCDLILFPCPMAPHGSHVEHVRPALR